MPYVVRLYRYDQQAYEVKPVAHNAKHVFEKYWRCKRERSEKSYERSDTCKKWGASKKEKNKD